MQSRLAALLWHVAAPAQAMVVRRQKVLVQCFWRGGQELLKVPELRCNPFAARIVGLFSEDGSGELDFQKTINLFSVFSPRATPETKVVWAFAVWDFDGASCLSRLSTASLLGLLGLTCVLTGVRMPSIWATVPCMCDAAPLQRARTARSALPVRR